MSDGAIIETPLVGNPYLYLAIIFPERIVRLIFLVRLGGLIFFS